MQRKQLVEMFLKESTIEIHKSEKEAKMGEHFATIKHGKHPEIHLHAASRHTDGISHMADDSESEVKKHARAHANALGLGKVHSVKRNGESVDVECEHGSTDLDIKKHPDGKHTMQHNGAHETFNMPVGKHKY